MANHHGAHRLLGEKSSLRNGLECCRYRCHVGIPRPLHVLAQGQHSAATRHRREDDDAHPAGVSEPQDRAGYDLQADDPSRDIAAAIPCQAAVSTIEVAKDLWAKPST